MQNPFESGHIRNYILFYISIVVVMILFFVASTLFNDISSVDKKVFNVSKEVDVKKNSNDTNSTSRIKLLDASRVYD